MKKALVIALLVIAAVPLLIGVADLPPHGDPDAPIHTHVSAYYLENGVEEAGTDNVVTAVILNYRGIDTSGEVTVIFTALASVFVILLPASRREAREELIAPVPLSPVVAFIVRILAPFGAVFALYVMAHGHSSPGGGFQAGAILGGLFIALSIVMGGSAMNPPMDRPIASWLRIVAPLSFVSMGVLGLALTGYFLGYPMQEELHAVREAMVTVIEVGIGVGGAVIFATMYAELEAQ